MNKILLIILLLSIVSLASSLKTKLSRPIKESDVKCERRYHIKSIDCECRAKYKCSHRDVKDYCASFKNSPPSIIELPQEWVDKYTVKRKIS